MLDSFELLKHENDVRMAYTKTLLTKFTDKVCDDAEMFRIVDKNKRKLAKYSQEVFKKIFDIS